MEILVLLLLYYLSQNPEFPDRVKPIMSQLKNSQQMLHFLNDLSAFSHLFDGLKTATPNPDAAKKTPPKDKPIDDDKEKNPQSPTQGIADEFIQKILDGYLSKQ